MVFGVLRGQGIGRVCYYVYEVSVYHPSSLQIEKCVSYDPYARGLSANGKRTLLVNLDSDDVKPEGWNHLQDEKPNLLSFSDVSIYELHVRDFSATDPTVAHELQGGYLAFTLQDSAGVKHLKILSTAGITHVHLLSTFQFAGVEDEKHKWKHPYIEKLNSFPPDSEEQQALIHQMSHVTVTFQIMQPRMGGLILMSVAKMAVKMIPVLTCTEEGMQNPWEMIIMTKNNQVACSFRYEPLLWIGLG